jgi:hypothetical protein
LQADDKLALLQHGTRLYLVDTSAVSRDLFRQLLLVRWEAPRVMSLAEPLPVKQLMAAALQLEEAAGRWQVCTNAGAVKCSCQAVPGCFDRCACEEWGKLWFLLCCGKLGLLHLHPAQGGVRCGVASC